jgi:hypothetical protein
VSVRVHSWVEGGQKGMVADKGGGGGRVIRGYSIYRWMLGYTIHRWWLDVRIVVCGGTNQSIC